MAVRLPRLLSSTELVDDQRRASLPFQRYWQSLVELIERAINAIAELTGVTDQLDEAIKAARDAAERAQSAADDAAQQTAATKREAALQGSYIDPASVLTATAASITIAAHTRMYADGVSKTVAGASVNSTGSGKTDYVFYDDPLRAGGAVTYQVSEEAPVQTGDRHVVGAVVIPAVDAPPAEGGEGPRRPGYVSPRFDNANEV